MRLPQARFEFQRLPQRLHGIAATPGGITRDSEVQMIFSYVGGKLHQLLVAADCVFPIFLVVGPPSRLGNLVNFALLSCARGMWRARFANDLSGKSTRGNGHCPKQDDDFGKSRQSVTLPARFNAMRIGERAKRVKARESCQFRVARRIVLSQAREEFKPPIHHETRSTRRCTENPGASVCLRGETGRLAAGSLPELQSRAKACYLFLLFAT